LRTSVSAETLPSAHVVRSYKQLKEVERAFGTLKGPLELRPIHHRLEDRVKAHVFLCTLAYYLAWHLRQAPQPMLFDDEHPTVARWPANWSAQLGSHAWSPGIAIAGRPRERPVISSEARVRCCRDARSSRRAPRGGRARAARV